MADKITKCKVVCGAQLSQTLQVKWCPDCPFNPNVNGKVTAQDIAALQNIVSKALAATARNCDRFASAEEAWDAYDAWVESYRTKGKTEPFNEFGWLFAPATEQEGGAK